MKRHISDITGIELEGIVKSMFPRAFYHNLVWRFNPNSNARVIQFYTTGMEYEFLIRYNNDTLDFKYFEKGDELRIAPEEYDNIKIQLKQLGFNVQKT